jgi:tetratricopeptide (TPR) repeat protein
MKFPIDYYRLMPRNKRFFISIFGATMLWCSLLQAHAQDIKINNSRLNADLFYQILLSEIYERSDNHSAAFAQMSATATQFNSPQLFQRSIEIALRARSGESALKAAQAWCKAFPKSLDANRYLLQILLILNKNTESVAVIQKTLDALDSADKNTFMGLILRDFARIPDKKIALESLTLALQKEMANPQTGATAWSAIGVLRQLNADFTGALEAAEKGAKLNTQAQGPIFLAIDLIAPERPEAEALVKKYTNGKPVPAIRIRYAQKLIEQKRYSDATIQAIALTNEAPSYADGWLLRGTLNWQEKKSLDAEAELKKFISLKNQEIKNSTAESNQRSFNAAYFMLAQIAEMQKKFSDASEYLALISNPEDRMRVTSLEASILAKQGRIQEARDLIVGLPEIDADDAQLKLAAEVQLLRENKQHEQTYQLLAKMVGLFPNNMDFLYDFAVAAEKLKKFDEMEQSLRKIIAGKPDNPHAYNALGYSFAERNVRHDEARQLINHALKLTPDDPFILDSLAWLEFRLGNKAEALRLLTIAFRKKPDSEIAAHLGEVLWSLNFTDKAKAVWQEGIAIDSENETLITTIRRFSAP